MAYFSANVNFAKYDNLKTGTTQSISFYYAGPEVTYAQGLWPHAGYINKKYNGVTVGRYNMSNMGSGMALYVFCHENGHMLFGWPDLYWFGDYCTMGNRANDVNPEEFNDFFRADQGWIPTITITSAMNKVFKAIPNDTGYRYINPSKAQEMFYWSNVKNTGRWSNLKGKGILLYHFDGTISGNSSATSRCLYVVEANGTNQMASAQWPSPGSMATDFYFKGNNAEFSSTSTPASSWGLRIYNISAVADTMTFTVGTGTVAFQEPPALLRHFPATQGSLHLPFLTFEARLWENCIEPAAPGKRRRRPFLLREIIM